MTDVPVRRPWWPPRLEEVARRAEVSLASTSRALSGGSGPLPGAAQQVRHAAHELGYYKREGQQRLLILTSEVSRLGYWLTISGILDAAREMECHLETHFTVGPAERHHRTLATALAGRIDGVIVMDLDPLGLEILGMLPRDLPVAVAGGSPSQEGQTGHVPRAWIDDQAGAREATEHLIGLGHRSIAYVGVPPAGQPDRRQVGWSRALTNAGLPVGAPLATGWSGETGYRAASRLIAEEATAVVCGNDHLAAGMMAGLSAAGRSVPHDVSIVGMDDDPTIAATTPGLSTVRQDFAAVGAVAAHLALGTHPASAGDGQVEIPTELVLRGSTTAPL